MTIDTNSLIVQNGVEVWEKRVCLPQVLQGGIEDVILIFLSLNPYPPYVFFLPVNAQICIKKNEQMCEITLDN